MKEAAGDWWAGFVAANGRIRLEELTHIGCLWSAFQAFPATPLTWVVGCMFLILPFDVVRCPFGDNAHAN